jgi:rubredoxin
MASAERGRASELAKGDVSGLLVPEWVCPDCGASKKANV